MSTCLPQPTTPAAPENAQQVLPTTPPPGQTNQPTLNTTPESPAPVIQPPERLNKKRQTKFKSLPALSPDNNVNLPAAQPSVPPPTSQVKRLRCPNLRYLWLKLVRSPEGEL